MWKRELDSSWRPEPALGLKLVRELVVEPELAAVSEQGPVVELARRVEPVLELALTRRALSELSEVRSSEGFAHPAPCPWPARFLRSARGPLR